MALKSEVFFVDVLMINEVVHADMVDIMENMQDRLGEVPQTYKVLSGGDQLTCERQANAQTSDGWRFSHRLSTAA